MKVNYAYNIIALLLEAQLILSYFILMVVQKR